jgi:hypothetical protein
MISGRVSALSARTDIDRSLSLHHHQHSSHAEVERGLIAFRVD